MLAFTLATLLPIASAFPILGQMLPPPHLDSFYSQPENLNNLTTGQVYNSRHIIDVVGLGVRYAKAEQIAYRTNNTQGEPSYSIATVFTPFTPSEEPKVLSYQYYEDSVNIDCSTSYSISKSGSSFGNDSTAAIAFGLAQGWYVIVPDDEGARSGFIAGHEQGQAGLDGIKAGISHLKLDSKTPVSLLGYSGGASATVWMSSLSESYAPELNIVGAAHGGTPVDIEAMVNYIDHPNSLYSGFIVGAFTGLLNSYPAFEEQVWPHLNTTLQKAVNASRQPGFCEVQIVLDFMFKEWHTQADVDLLTYEPFKKIMANESLLSNVSATAVPVPKFPRYIWHGTKDMTIPISPVQQYVSEQCSSGANIQFVPWNGTDHLTTGLYGLPDALKFVKQSLEFNTPQVKCGSANNNILSLGPKMANQTLSKTFSEMVLAVDVLTSPLGEATLNRTGQAPLTWTTLEDN